MMEDIIGAMEAEYDDDIGQQSAALEAEAMMNKGFGGSGYALRQGEFDADATRGRNALRGQLRTNMWNTAIGAGANDAALAGQVGMFNAGQANQQAGQQAGFDQQARINNSGIGAQFGLSRFNAANQFGLADAAAANQMESQRFGTQADMNQFNANRRLQENAQRMAGAGLMGDMAQSQTQDQLSRLQGLLSLGQAQYGTDLASSPYGQLLALGGLLNPDGTLNTVTGNQFEGTSNSTQKTSGGLLGQLLAAGAQLGSAALMASERRVKRDIVKLDEETDGLGVYRFNYVWDAADEPQRFGVMADEVARIRPWALGPVIDGVQTVNMEALQ
jgi:hypothetical protein